MFLFSLLVIRRPPRSTRTDTLFPCTTLFRSTRGGAEHRSPRFRRRLFRVPDLGTAAAVPEAAGRHRPAGNHGASRGLGLPVRVRLLCAASRSRQGRHRLARSQDAAVARSEERRVGNECVSTCTSRGLSDHYNKKNNNTTMKLSTRTK